MEVSVVWLGLIVIGIALLFLFTQAKGVYDTFMDYDKEVSEGFISSNINDIW